MAMADEYAERVKKGELILLVNKGYDEYIEDLEQEIEELKEDRDDKSEAVVKLIAQDGTIINLVGKESMRVKFDK